MRNILKKNDNAFELITVACIAVLYVLLALTVNKSITVPTDFAYYNNLIDAFIHGRLNLLTSNTFDLSLYRGKWYAYWGPAGAVFVLPFYLVSGIRAPDILYTLVAALANLVLFSFVLREFIRYFGIRLVPRMRAVLIAAFGIMSPNFYMGLKGGIWQTNQIVAVFFLLWFLLFFFKFLQNQEKNIYLLASVIYFNLAWFTRYTMIFYGLLFIYALPLRYAKNRKIITYLITVIGIGFVFLGAFFFYNRARFGSPFETGMVYQKGVWRYDGYFQAKKIFSKTFIPHNTYYYFLNPIKAEAKFPFLKFDPEGNGMFFMYPFLLFLPFAFSEKMRRKHTRAVWFAVFALFIALLNLSVLLVNVGTGWVQLGTRYFFDSIPLLYLVAGFALSSIPELAVRLFFVYGLAINIWGTLLFHSVFKW